LGNKLWCETKGVKYTKFGKEPKLKVKQVKYEKMDSLLEVSLTEGRLEQGLQVLKRVPVEMKILGLFIKWVCAELVKEEKDRIDGV